MTQNVVTYFSYHKQLPSNKQSKGMGLDKILLQKMGIRATEKGKRTPKPRKLRKTDDT